ncbi:hypothetical protein [Candidatus Mycoplasma haematominutum]|nr:hypothetical protein [Candidatus Mycoplasma haematominutum]
MRVNLEGRSNTSPQSKHQSYREVLLVNRREIGAYIPASDSLVIDREVLLHYVLSGCQLNSALTRLIRRLLPEVPLRKQLEFSSLVSPESWQIQESAALLEKHDSVLAALHKPKKQKKARKK